MKSEKRGHIDPLVLYIPNQGNFYEKTVDNGNDRRNFIVYAQDLIEECNYEATGNSNL